MKYIREIEYFTRDIGAGLQTHSWLSSTDDRLFGILKIARREPNRPDIALLVLLTRLQQCQSLFRAAEL